MADKRERRGPSKFNDFELDMTSIEEPKRKKHKESQLWLIEEVIERLEDSVLVKWKDFDDSENSWVSLTDNPELSCYLAENAGNPYSSALARKEEHTISDDDRELWLVAMAIFDELQFTRTPENDSGLVRRVRVKVPLSKNAFSTLFAKGTFHLADLRELDFSGQRNVKFKCTAAEIASVFGTDSIARQFKDSSTVCEIDPSSKVNVSWGYDLRFNYDHELCPRCIFTGEEKKRPQKCQPQEKRLPALSFLELSFKKRRRNMVHNQGKVSLCDS